MSSQALVNPRAQVPAELQEKVLIGGDLAKLSVPERLSYYKAVCESVGLNPLTRPFEYLVLDDKTVLYARKDCTDQLRELHGVSVEIVCRERLDDLFVVTARAKNMTERIDESIGVVPAVKEDGEWKTAQSGKRYFQGNGLYKPLGLEARSNAMMKAETKAKRRVTLSICGLGMFDESELDGVPGARRMTHMEEESMPPLRTGAEMLAALEQKEKAQVEQTEDKPGDGAGTLQAEILTQQASDAPAPSDPPAQWPLPPSKSPNIFEQSSAVADHQLAIDEAGPDPVKAAAVWADVVADLRLSQVDRSALWHRQQKIVKPKKK
jgi:hypothetical protein